jgi:hypothetical protein
MRFRTGYDIDRVWADSGDQLGRIGVTLRDVEAGRCDSGFLSVNVTNGHATDMFDFVPCRDLKPAPETTA